MSPVAFACPAHISALTDDVPTNDRSMMDQDRSPSTTDEFTQQCERLLSESTTFPHFARELLQLLCDHLPVDAASLVDLSNREEPHITVEHNLQVISVDGFFGLDMDHLSLLAKTLRLRKTQVEIDRMLPEAGLRKHSVVMAPVLSDSHPPLVVELLALDALDDVRLSQLREHLETAAAYLARHLNDDKPQIDEATAETFWKRYSAFLLQLQRTTSLQETLLIAVNDGRILIGADRVSIALQYGTQTRLAAISGQPRVQQRANLVQALTNVTTEAMRWNQPLTYQGTMDGLPDSLQAPLAEYLAESRTRMVMFRPLSVPAALNERNRDDASTSHMPTHSSKRLGCLIVEQMTAAQPDRRMVQRTELLEQHLEAAIHRCQEYDSIFLLPFRKSLGQGMRWFRGRRGWLALACLLVGVSLALTLGLVQWEYRVEGSGSAFPVIQHDVFAPWDGEVVEVFVEGGQRVVAGQQLLRIESDDLDADRIATQSEVLEKEKLVSALKLQRAAAERTDNADEFIRVSAELAKASVEQQGALARLQKIERRIEKLTVTAPDDGVIATFQVDQLLRNRPVSRGELLVEVMEPDGPWRLELDVPEHRMGHLLRALSSSEDDSLMVRYVPATAVETSLKGTLRRSGIATRADVSASVGNRVEVHVDINRDDLPQQNIGAEVTAKIHCGQKSLFFVLFGDVIEFVLRYVWL